MKSFLALFLLIGFAEVGAARADIWRFDDLYIEKKDGALESNENSRQGPAKFLKKPPRVQVSSYVVKKGGQKFVAVDVYLSHRNLYRQWILQLATSQEFSEGTLVTKRVRKPLTRLTYTDPVRLWFRARGISRKNELSEWGPIIELNVTDPSQKADVTIRPALEKKAPVRETANISNETDLAVAPLLLPHPVPTSSPEAMPAPPEPSVMSEVQAQDAEPPREPLNVAPMPRLTAVPESPSSDPRASRIWLTGALGVAAYQLSEELADVSARYLGLSAPTKSFGAGADFGNNLSVETEYRSLAYKVDNSTVNLPDIQGEAQQASAFAAYGLDADEAQLSRQVLLGVQLDQFQVPLFKNNNNQPLLRTLQAVSLGAGARLRQVLDRSTRAAYTARLALPISVSAVAQNARIASSPGLRLTGSALVERNIVGSKWIGVGARVDYDKFTYDYVDPQTTASGAHSWLSVTIEVRFRLDF